MPTPRSREPVTPLRAFYSCHSSAVRRGRWINKLTVCRRGCRRGRGGPRWEFHAHETNHATSEHRDERSSAAQSLPRLNLFTIGSFNELHFGPRRIPGCYRAQSCGRCVARDEARGEKIMGVVYRVTLLRGPLPCRRTAAACFCLSFRM